jgi:CheY-like chemotaxis protein
LDNENKVLIVDDEAYIRRVLELKLKTKGYDVITANNGIEGLEKFNLHHPDIVITDIKMPGMDGQTMCEKINNTSNKKPFLIIVVTCSLSDNNLQWLKKMDNALLLEKPFSPSRILDKIRAFSDSKR